MSRIPEGFVACTFDWVRCATCRKRVLTGSEDKHRCPGTNGSGTEQQ